MKRMNKWANGWLYIVLKKSNEIMYTMSLGKQLMYCGYSVYVFPTQKRIQESSAKIPTVFKNLIVFIWLLKLSSKSGSVSSGHYPNKVSHTSFLGELWSVLVGPEWSYDTRIFSCPFLFSIKLSSWCVFSLGLICYKKADSYPNF